ncbi:DUF2169 domain-containing protein [Duganella violaceipulchra]|uniref:DUF2169 domain-containing protein n=1 Tax=Duganella violaceipulchra TaxID=2849652 RepID=A0AA41HB58_9BURK|nr:DUF2169 domain-containing protein [Duganella violaceicalia]MBV6320916.1 DUF2169 domain-containing protein [Duganella violaceicalia]MCP2008372.1 hypothetical protein [Duganella violaceicalia]
MEFVNYTPFPAQAFEGIDQHRRPFHVVTLRQTLNFATGTLKYANAQAPLCEGNVCFGEIGGVGVRQESDLCHYKPKCDVIVNAAAYAPQGKPRTCFPVRLRVAKPDAPAPMPQHPQGLNQFENAAPEIMACWRKAVQHAEQHPVPGALLINKTLIVNGEREFKKKAGITRTLYGLLRLSTLGLLRLNPWRLTDAKRVTMLPLRYERAYGGECRIEAGDSAAHRLPRKQRSVLAGLPARDNTLALLPALHSVYEPNPRGTGYVEPSYLRATRVRAIAAPQIELPGAPLCAWKFWQALRGSPNDAARDNPSALQPAGFGIRPGSHPARRAFAGTVDQTFLKGDDALPADFDFAFWNAAPPDQQTDFLHGNETFELINLCAPDTPGATLDRDGNTTLRLKLSGHECFVLVRQEDGTLFRQALALDTVLLEPEERLLTLVWRGILPKDADVPLRRCEARMHSHEERDRVLREVNFLDRYAGAAESSPSWKVEGAP